MANISSTQDGDWNTASTWSGGVVPTANDKAYIFHKVTFKADITALDITIGNGGSLTVADDWTATTSINVTASYIFLTRNLNDDRVVRMDGAILDLTPAISCIGSLSVDGFPDTSGIYHNVATGILIDDPGLYGFSAQMQDIKPEGCARAYARKVSNGVRYLNVIVHIRKDKGDTVGLLYRMAENPFQVLAVTNSAVIKGFIEAITPVDSVGKEYRSFRVSIAEGL